jgi:Ni2+-binding GTPase involved in maturation of urease and hydrogenase
MRDAGLLERKIQAVRPGMRVFTVSAKTGQGLQHYMDFLTERLVEQREETAV